MIESFFCLGWILVLILVAFYIIYGSFIFDDQYGFIINQESKYTKLNEIIK